MEEEIFTGTLGVKHDSFPDQALGKRVTHSVDVM